MKKDTTKKLRRFLFLCIVAVVALVVAIWYYNQPKTDIGAKSKPIVVGYLPIYVDIPLFVAEGEGLFEKYGVEVELKKFESSPDMGAALLSGDIDAIASIASATAFSIESRDPGRFKVFMVDQATPSAPLSSLVLPEGSDVKSIADLEGKVVGSFPGPTATILAPLAFQNAQLSPDKLKIVSFPPSSHLEILATKQVDALITYEPSVTQAKMRNGATIQTFGFIETYLMDPWPAGSWLISSKMLETPEGRENSEKFYKAIFEATDTLRTDPNEVKRHLSTYTLIDSEIANAAPNIGFTKANEANDDAFQGYADLLFEQGVIDNRIDTDQLLLDF